MSETNNKTTLNLMSSSIVLTLAFFIAKVAGAISWSWWWVFSPLWLPFVIVGGLVVLGVLIYLLLLIVGAVLS